jgi:2-oxoglutarate ferredoxin oxidoreductase subunit beta
VSTRALSKKDFASDQEVRWCPGCGDYAILATVQGFLPELGVPPERVVFVTGIGCAGRFVYYMNTYGLHSIHGRAPAVATGVALARPDLDVWVIGGDGDMLSIGGNHLIHALRRNVNLKILLFNNQIYGLTKGQASPTSEEGKVTKSTPFGSLDHPFNPVALALGAEATFVARTIDSDRQHFASILKQAAAHRGTAFIEVYQNCVVFNDDAFVALTGKQTRVRNQIRLEQDRPILFRDNDEQCIYITDDGTLGIGDTASVPQSDLRQAAPREAWPGLRQHPRTAQDADLHRGLPRRRATRLRRNDGPAGPAGHREARSRRPDEAPARRRHLGRRLVPTRAASGAPPTRVLPFPSAVPRRSAGPPGPARRPPRSCPP